jgi:hypothetical protein
MNKLLRKILSNMRRFITLNKWGKIIFVLLSPWFDAPSNHKSSRSLTVSITNYVSLPLPVAMVSGFSLSMLIKSWLLATMGEIQGPIATISCYLDTMSYLTFVIGTCYAILYIYGQTFWSWLRVRTIMSLLSWHISTAEMPPIKYFFTTSVFALRLACHGRCWTISIGSILQAQRSDP